MPRREIEERAFQFGVRIAKTYDFLQKQRGSARALSRQLLKAGSSIGANLEEATAGQSRADFIAKCSIAAKEARETLYWLRLIIAANPRLGTKLEKLKQEAGELVAITTTIVKRAQNNQVIRAQN